MALFNLSAYRLRQLDPAQGVKPLDFGGDAITGSINTDGRFIAINTYHPEYGYMTLSSIPPFADEDRYDQQKVRAYRKSLVSDAGFGLEFEQEIIKREYYLIEDAVPFMRFTLADGTVAECVTKVHSTEVSQLWLFNKSPVKFRVTGDIRFMRAAYTQLTEGGFNPAPSTTTKIDEELKYGFIVCNPALTSRDDFASLRGFPAVEELDNGSIRLDSDLINDNDSGYILNVQFEYTHADLGHPSLPFQLKTGLNLALEEVAEINQDVHPVITRATAYAIMTLDTRWHAWLTDHMILPLQWNRDSYYVARHILDTLSSKSNLVKKHLEFTFKRAWRGTYSQSAYEPVSSAWARSYYANGMPKDTKAFQLDQQIYPLLEFADYVQATHDIPFALEYLPRINEVLEMLTYHYAGSVMVDTDETPADDDIPLPLHFSSHVLLWHTLKKLVEIYSHRNLSKHQHIGRWINELVHGIRSRFITVHQGKKIYAYAASKEDQNYYFYHDANDIPLVMMPLWGFCDKDDEIWLNTIEFAFSDANPGFFDGVLGSVHTPAPWSLGDAQELIFCKVIGDKARYERVWQRVEKAAQWDGALPEAYDAKTGEVVSRHWFAWTNAMIAIADGISWNWETEGEYAR